MSMRRLSAGAACALWLWAAAAAGENPPEDAWITAKVKMNLLTAKELDARAIHVDTFDGRVALAGTVGSESAEVRAESRAWSVKGVTDVTSFLAIVPHEGRQAPVSDGELARRVSEVLERDGALVGSRVQVATVDAGVVHLVGRAETLTMHLRALEDARRVEGVRGVVTEIRSPDELADVEVWADLAPDRTSPLWRAASDGWITARAKVRLMSEPGLSPEKIHVDTRDGVPTLFGIVASNAERSAAETAVHSVEGVRSIENALQVVADSRTGDVGARDESIREAVEARLDDREALEDAEIRVDVSRGVVRLAGDVSCHRDRITALTLARSVGGAQSVLDELGIRRAN